ncbi:MAG: AAA family ATPase [Synergistaceae bacterium]|jgi:predicted ATPase|nr:AAA family ATPase [Synergistaceae bacterium]
MKLKKISLVNWKNFQSVSAEIQDRLFIVGANASGKSNFLDAIRFMRDIVKHGGGLQYAVSSRGGLSKIRCLSAREDPNVQIYMVFEDDENTQWGYSLSIGQEQRGKRNAIIKQECIKRDGVEILSRPNKNDTEDEDMLTQTHLEQITTNKEFRDIIRFLEPIKYTHLVPQLLKFPDAFSGPDLPEDPFGKGFLKTIAKTPLKTRDSRLQKIQGILQTAVPQLNNLTYVEDIGQPHLEVTYKHWRPHGAKQSENQLSDGTLRLIGLLWSLLDGQGLLLLEEPELSLHTAIVEKLPEMLYSITRAKKRQIIMTTHSSELLSDKSISLSQILLLKTGAEGTTAYLASEREEIKAMLASGMTPAEMVIPFTQPDEKQRLLFE